MQIQNAVYQDGIWSLNPQTPMQEAQIVFVFGDTDTFKLAQTYTSLRDVFPHAHLVGCSSSGNVLGDSIRSQALVATAVKLEKGRIQVASIDFAQGDNVELLAKDLVSRLPQDELKHVFILSDGLNINGSELVRGVNRAVQVPVTGGMAGDGARFSETYVIADDVAKSYRIVAVGFYGESLSIGSGCFGGWTAFGTFRTITKSSANVLYEIDGQPALDLYKTYLGEHAKDLPYSGLRFPLSIKKDDQDTEVIRTLLAIDEEQKSITFAGDVPEGYSARLMKPDLDMLIDGAGHAAEAIDQVNNNTALGLVVSCVGRKIVMSQLVDEELEAVSEILGDQVQLVGFYSYGEIAPFNDNALNCQLHNQTMTLTVIYED